MSRRRTVPLDQLWLAGQAPGVLRLGPLFASLSDPKNATESGRWSSVVGYDDRFVLLVDEFRARSVQAVELALAAPEPIRPHGRQAQVRLKKEKVSLHVLGDYAVNHERDRLTLTQRLASGRFLIALTRDPEATVRVAHGWAVEVRSRGRTYQILHSNRSGKLRPVGPIQTDARAGVVEWPDTPDRWLSTPDQATLRVLQASQVVWGEKKLQSEIRVDMQCLACSDRIHAVISQTEKTR